MEIAEPKTSQVTNEAEKNATGLLNTRGDGEKLNGPHPQTPTVPKNPVFKSQPKLDEELQPPMVALLNASDPSESKENSEQKQKSLTDPTAASENISATLTRPYCFVDDTATSLSQEDKIVHERDFLMSLQYSEPSKQKADILQNVPYIPCDGKGRDCSSVGGDKQNLFQRQSSSTERQIDQTDKGADGKLNRVNHAWKPDKDPAENMAEEDRMHEALLKSFRGILNKITPRWFESLLEQALKLPVRTERNLLGIVNLFEKAIDEPKYSDTFAALWHKIAKNLKVPSVADANEEMNFSNLLHGLCRKKDDACYNDDQEQTRRKEAIVQASNEEKPRLQKEYMLFVHDAYRRKFGYIRFIGELFKLKMLAPKMMHDCIVQLLKRSEEEDLECLCGLLTTIGKELDTDQARQRTSKYFTVMGMIASGRYKKVSSRIRFALQDIINLRKNDWRPISYKLKKIHEEAAREALETKLKIEKGIPSQGIERSNRDRPAQGNYGGWYQVGVLQRKEPSKLKIKNQFVEGEDPLFFWRSRRGNPGSKNDTPPQQENRPSTPTVSSGSNIQATLGINDSPGLGGLLSSQRLAVNQGSLNSEMTDES